MLPSEGGTTLGAVESLSLMTESLRARLRGLRVVIEETPSAEFQDALEHLVPADDEVARLVHRTLSEPTSVPKKNVIVLQRGEPILATTVRARQDRWEIATTTVAPTLPIPCREGMLEPALSSLGLRILIVDHVGDAHADFARHRLVPFDSYVATLNGFDFEAYWRSTRLWEDLRRVERKTAEWDIVHDDPATLDWSIDTWEGRWTDHPNDEAGAADDLRALWPELLRMKRLMSTALVTPDGSAVASTVNIIDGDTLVGLITARDVAMPTSTGSVGTRVAVECFNAARSAGLAKVDIGGYHDHYKRRLTPAGRVAYGVEIEPRIFSAGMAERAEHVARSTKRGLRRLARR
ncbi:hypothetical protein MIC448_920017 [Microbacterium sp. C448]|nr:hypothetical protein MIC448_920017 [Microbacterium sp. C448]